MYREMGMTYWLEKLKRNWESGDGVTSSRVDELQEFVHDHRVHGALTADATEPAWNGYRLTVTCPCGVVFERWIAQVDAELDLLRATRLN